MKKQEDFNILIKQVQQKNETAFKELTLCIQNDLYRIAKTRLNNDDDICDAIQNAMIITYKNVKNIKDIKSFKSWIFRVLINECNKIYNLNKKHNEVYNKITYDIEFNKFDSTLQKVQEKMNFESLINSLPYNEKIIIILHYGEMLSCEEIAKILKINVNTAKSRLIRGKNKLKKIYEEENCYE